MKLPLTLRIAYHSFRSVIRAALLFFIAWIIFIPASADENVALGVSQDVQYPPGLRTMRMAQVVVTVAPPQLYTLVARASGRDIPPFLIQVAMMQMAAGNVLPATAKVAPKIESSREIDGPRFIQVD